MAPDQPSTLPPDLPDDPVDAMPVFTSRRKAEALPPLRPVPVSNVLDAGADRGWCRVLARADWQAGFRWGVLATLGGLALFAIVAVRVLT